MMDYLNYINDNYPIRKTDDEKQAFRNYVIEDIRNTNYCTNIEVIDKHQNIIIGDIHSAKVIYTAHYDTPATSIIPNLMTPRNKGLWIISHFTLPIVLSLISYNIGYLLANSITEIPFIKIFLLIFFWFGIMGLSLYLLTGAFKNKHNKNDNTSGIATIMSLIHQCTSNEVAFVLFDNEEKGLLGSKAFNKKYSNLLVNKMVINFDCVGVGNNILFIAKEKAMNHALYEKLVMNCESNNDFNVEFYSIEVSHSNSDYKSFECGIGVMACKKKNNVYYTGKIHTNRDTEAYNENIEFLVNNMNHFINDISY